MEITNFNVTNTNYKGIVSILNYDNLFEGKKATIYFNLGILEIKRNNLYTAKIEIIGPNNNSYRSNDFIIDGNSVINENHLYGDYSAGIYNLSVDIPLHSGTYKATVTLTNYENETNAKECVNLTAKTYFYVKRNPPHPQNTNNMGSQASKKS